MLMAVELLVHLPVNGVPLSQWINGDEKEKSGFL